MELKTVNCQYARMLHKRSLIVRSLLYYCAQLLL